MNPICKFRKLIINKGLNENDLTVFATGLAICLNEHPELKQVIEIWTQLSDKIKKLILDLCKLNDEK